MSGWPGDTGDHPAEWGAGLEPRDPVDPIGGVDEQAPAGIPTAGAVGLDAIMLALATIADELKRIADVLERVDEKGVTTYDGNVI